MDEVMPPPLDGMAELVGLIAAQQGAVPVSDEAVVLPPPERPEGAEPAVDPGDNADRDSDGKLIVGSAKLIAALARDQRKKQLREENRKVECPDCGSTKMRHVPSATGSLQLTCGVCGYATSIGVVPTAATFAPLTPYEIPALMQQPPIGPYYRTDTQGGIGASSVNSPLAAWGEMLRRPMHRRQ
jgi:predicted RNA-binding Zn-ribbon protein involved in translation (DUF1610 family)